MWLFTWVGGGFICLYLLELICRLTPLRRDSIPSAWLAWAGSQIFTFCASVTYGFLDICRRAWEYLLRLPLWRQMLESLSVFTRVIEFLLSPLGFLFGAIKYITWRVVYWTGSAMPNEVAQAFNNIRSIPDWIASYCRVDLSRYHFGPSVYCSVICGLVIATVWMYGPEVLNFCRNRWIAAR